MAILAYPVTIIIDLTPVKEGTQSLRFRVTDHIENELKAWLPFTSGSAHHVRTIIDLSTWKATCAIHMGEFPPQLR